MWHCRPHLPLPFFCSCRSLSFGRQEAPAAGSGRLRPAQSHTAAHSLFAFCLFYSFLLAAWTFLHALGCMAISVMIFSPLFFIRSPLNVMYACKKWIICNGNRDLEGFEAWIWLFELFCDVILVQMPYGCVNSALRTWSDFYTCFLITNLNPKTILDLRTERAVLGLFRLEFKTLTLSVFLIDFVSWPRIVGSISLCIVSVDGLTD